MKSKKIQAAELPSIDISKSYVFLFLFFLVLTKPLQHHIYFTLA